MNLWAYRFDVYVVGVNLLLRLPGFRLRRAVLRHIARIEFGDRCAFERGVRVMGRGGVRVGENCNINRDVLLDGGGRLVIGSLVNISPEAVLLTTEHDPNSPSFEGRDRAVLIGDRVWIASRAMILPGTHIGEGAIVAAGAVAHGQVPSWSIVAGNPASVIGHRSRDAQATLPYYQRLLH